MLAAAAVAAVVVFVARALVSISSLVGFLNSRSKCSVAAAAAAVLLFSFAAQLLAAVAAAVAVTGLAQCTGSRDLTRQSVALSPDLLV